MFPRRTMWPGGVWSTRFATSLPVQRLSVSTGNFNCACSASPIRCMSKISFTPSATLCAVPRRMIFLALCSWRNRSVGRRCSKETLLISFPHSLRKFKSARTSTVFPSISSGGRSVRTGTSLWHFSSVLESDAGALSRVDAPSGLFISPFTSSMMP